jgi:hypothetical protein
LSALPSALAGIAGRVARLLAAMLARQADVKA